jgi:hypothetical protein
MYFKARKVSQLPSSRTLANAAIEDHIRQIFAVETRIDKLRSEYEDRGENLPLEVSARTRPNPCWRSSRPGSMSSYPARHDLRDVRPMNFSSSAGPLRLRPRIQQRLHGSLEVPCLHSLGIGAILDVHVVAFSAKGLAINGAAPSPATTP